MDSFRRLVARTLAQTFTPEFEAATASAQVAVGTRAGLEAAVHAARTTDGPMISVRMHAGYDEEQRIFDTAAARCLFGSAPGVEAKQCRSGLHTRQYLIVAGLEY